MSLRAVFTSDIVHSTLMVKQKETRLMKVLAQVLGEDQFEFYRGDSFQAYLKQPSQALQTALLCRTAAIALNEGKQLFDIRIGIGIGQVTKPVKKLGETTEEAFVLSGRGFDAIRNTDKRLTITAADDLATVGLDVVSDYVDSILKRMTGKQAATIFQLLKGVTQQSIASQLKKSKSTVSQYVQAGRWQELEKLLVQYEKIINYLA